MLVNPAVLDGSRFVFAYILSLYAAERNTFNEVFLRTPIRNAGHHRELFRRREMPKQIIQLLTENSMEHFKPELTAYLDYYSNRRIKA